MLLGRKAHWEPVCLEMALGFSGSPWISRHSPLDQGRPCAQAFSLHSCASHPHHPLPPANSSFQPLPARTSVTPWPLEKADLPELTHPVWASGHSMLSRPRNPEGKSPFPFRILKFLVPASQSLREKAVSTKTMSLPEDGACVRL